MEVQFRGRYTPWEIWRGAILLSRSSPFWIFLRLAASLAFIILFILYVIDVFSSPDVASVRLVRLLRFSIPFAIALYVLGKPLFALVRLYLEFGIRGERSGVVNGEINPTGVRFFYTKSLRVEIPWAEIYHKRVTPDLIVLRTLSGLPILLPRSFFQKDEDWQIAQNWVKSKVIEAKG